jgi:hypothetical protein
VESLDNVFDDITDELIASIPDVHVSDVSGSQTTPADVPVFGTATAPADVPVVAATGPKMLNGPRMLNGPTVTNTCQQVRKRTSDRLRKLKTKKITGPGATAATPMVLDESEEGVLTQEETTVGTKEGLVLPIIRTMKTVVAEK